MNASSLHFPGSLGIALGLVLVACGPGARYEGSEPGDCSDGADNDIDGAFDCADLGCAGSPACAASDGGLEVPDGGLAVPRSYVFEARDFVCAPVESPPCQTLVPVRSADQRTVDLPSPLTPPQTDVYLLSMISVPANARASAVGFNLDGLDSSSGSASGSCEEATPDYQSATESLHPGVDNAYAALIPIIEGQVDIATCPGGRREGCVDAQTQARINDGSLLLVVEISGIDDRVFDDEVTVLLYEVSSDSLALGADGRPAPGQSFGTVAPLGAAAPGDIFEGRLRVRFANLPFLVSNGATLSASLRDAELRASLEEGSLRNGLLGGVMEVDALVAASEAASPGSGALVESVLNSIADIAPRADPAVCSRISVGMAFEAVAATRVP